MKESGKNIEDLIYEELIGQISESDLDELNMWIARSDANKESYNRIKNSYELTSKYEAYDAIDADRAWKKFEKEHIHTDSKVFLVRTRLNYLMRYAAILIPFAIVLGVLFMWTGKEASSEEHSTYVERSELSGRNKAVLTLPNGDKVALGNESEERTKSQVKSKENINQSAKSQKIVKDPKQTSSKDLLALFNESNKLTTYTNSEYWVTLDDGTQVHLNYNTSLIYPTKFNSKDRTVYLDGEAYFVVAKDKKRPFRVVTNNGIVQQYGTSFNVNTQVSGQTKVVLVEGSVSVIDNADIEYKMHPGELAIINSESNVQIEKVDIESYIAWNRGRFIFQDLPLDSIMNTISGWYGMEVSFVNQEDKSMKFTGDMDRYESVELIMKALGRATQLKIEVKGDQITVGE